MSDSFLSARRIAPLEQSRNPFKFQLDCPADKSLTHRAIFFNCIATGKSRIVNPLLGEDCLTTIKAFQALGVQISKLEDGAIEIDSLGMKQFVSPTAPLDMGNSGTTCRLMIGLLASIPGMETTFIGDDSLSKRPMGRIVQPLLKAGAMIRSVDGGPADRLPLHIIGCQLSPIEHKFDKASAQIKSALLFAALNVEGTSQLHLPAGSRDHTEKILLQMKASLTVSDNQSLGAEECLDFKGPFLPVAKDYRIPADPSSAAFFAVLAALFPGSVVLAPGVLSNITRTGFVEVLMKMGMGVSVEKQSGDQDLIEETVNYRFVGPSRLQAVEVLAEQVPTMIDEIPLLAIAAMFAEGQSRFCGLGELRVKESDRLGATVRLIKLAGGECQVEGDDLIVVGRQEQLNQLNNSQQSFEFDPQGDHRLAMAAAVLSKRLGGGLIKGSDCVRVSFPEFFDLLEGIG